MSEITEETQQMANRLSEFSIELDCPPGNPRPSDLIRGVLDDTGLTEDDFNTAPPFFGHQTWVLKPGDYARDLAFKAAKPQFKERVTALYHAGRIRYGTW